MGGSSTTVQSDSKSKQTTQIPAEIRKRGTQISKGAMNHYFDPAKKYQGFDYGKYAQEGQDMTGQLNQYHQQAGQNLANAGGSYQNASQAAANQVTDSRNANQAGNFQGDQYNSQNLQQYMNPYTQNVIDQGVRQIGDQMNQGRLNNQSRAAQAGAFGGARHGVLDSLNQQNAMQTMSDFVGNQMAQNYGQAQNQFNTNFGQGLQEQNQNNQAAQQNFNMDQSLAQIYQNLGQQDFQNQNTLAQANTNLGNIYTAQEQAQKDNAYKAYDRYQEKPMELYERLAAINAMQPHNRTTIGTSSGSSTQGQSGGWLGPAIGAAANIGMAFSDERTKENVEEIDAEKTLSAFAAVPPKEYEYKEEISRAHPNLAARGRRRGFMAQDYEKAFGRKSGETVDGYKTIDHAQVIGDLVNAVHGLEKRTRKLKRKG